MEFKTAEEKLLHDYDLLEDENMRLCDENRLLLKRVEQLEERIADIGEQAHRLIVERDHHADCVKDMLATAAFYGFEQPTKIRYNPETQTMQPDEDDGRRAFQAKRDEGLA